MWRYYLVATLIVVAIGSVAFAHRWFAEHRGANAGRSVGFAGSPASGAPTFGNGEGPWVMSALPGCFDQQRSIVGPSDMLARDVPPPRERLAAGTMLVWNDCTVRVGASDVRIARGSDRLRVPPQAALYARGGKLTLVWTSRHGRTEIREYARSRMP